MPTSKNKPRRDLISRAEAARRRGVSRAAVTKACRTTLRDACVGRRIDAAHASFRLWVIEADQAPTAPHIPELARIALEKRKVELRKLQLDLAEREGRLIPVDGVTTVCFAYLDTLGRRLLRDAGHTVIARAYGLAKSGAPQEEGRAAYVEIISGHLSVTKKQVADWLRGASRGRSTKTEARR
jgi:hypothetical protein